MTGKYQDPKDIKELERIYYEKDAENERRQHESRQRQILSSYYEKDAKNTFVCVGDVTKIPRNVNKTFDFEIKSKNIMFEVTQIAPPLPSSINPSIDQSDKIRKAIEHVGEKESNASVVRGGAIYYSTVISFITNLSEQLQNEKFIICEMTKYNLDFILFLPKPAVNLNPYEKIPCPKLFYISKEYKTVFECIDSSIQRFEF